MNKIYIHEIAEAVGAQCKTDGEIFNISTNSKEVKAGDAFVAIKGDRFDGHNFIFDALDKGCSCVIAHREVYTEDDRIIYVGDTKQALLDIAKMYKKKFNVKSVGVTGSVGKTTSKDFVACVLESKYKTLKSEGNENNEIGLPKTVFKLDDSYEACVFEMGMSGSGEIRQLTEVVEPDVGVITNIGVSHLEYLKTRENILKAKMEICEGMKNGSPLIICGDNDLLKDVTDSRLKVIKYGVENKDCHILGQNITETTTSTSFDIVAEGKSYRVKIPTIGIHNVLNALAAAAVGMELEVSMEDIVKSLENYQPSGMRQRIIEIDGITVVEDCYNASPDSMKAAMKTFGEMKNTGRKIVVLGDMLELGSISEEAHRAVGDILSANGIDEAFTYGEEMKLCTARAYELGIQAVNYEDKEELARELLREIKSGDAIWVKGSRGMRLEEVIEKIYNVIGK